MDGIPVLGNAVLGPGIQRRTPVDLVRQLRLSQRELLPEQQRDLLPSLPSQLAETGQSGKFAHSARFHSKSRSLSPSRRLPAPGEVPWQKFWNGPRERSASRTPSFQRGAIGARASRNASRKASRSRGRGSQSPRSPSRPSSPLLVDSRSAALNERNETRRDRNDRNDRKFELHTLDKSPQGECRDLSDSPLFTVSWDPYTGLLQRTTPETPELGEASLRLISMHPRNVKRAQQERERERERERESSASKGKHSDTNCDHESCEDGRGITIPRLKITKWSAKPGEQKQLTNRKSGDLPCVLSL